MLHTAIGGLMKMRTRRGMLVEEMGQIYLADPNADGDEARTLRPLQAAAATYRIAFGPRASTTRLVMSPLEFMHREVGPQGLRTEPQWLPNWSEPG